MNQASEKNELQSPLLQTNVSEEETFRYGFRIADLGLLIPQGAHSTFIENTPIFSLPNTTDWLKGLVNVRGSIVPVFDLGKMLQIEIKPVKKSVITMTFRSRAFAFNVDSAQSVKESELSLSNSSAPDEFKEFSGAVYKDNKTAWIEFDFIRCLQHYENQMSA